MNQYRNNDLSDLSQASPAQIFYPSPLIFNIKTSETQGDGQFGEKLPLFALLPAGPFPNQPSRLGDALQQYLCFVRFGGFGTVTLLCQ